MNKIQVKTKDTKTQNEVPGPGAYSPMLPISRGRTILQKYNIRTLDANPGVGEYEVTPVYKKAPVCVFPKASKECETRVRCHAESQLAPNFYFRTCHPHSIQYRSNNAQNSPSLKGRYRSEGTSGVPGPGTYMIDHVSVFKKIPGVKILPVLPKLDSHNFSNPGPGAYNILETHISHALPFTSREYSFDSRSDLPAPGSYEVLDAQTARGPKFSPVPQHRCKEVDDRPGPGWYNPSLIKKSRVIKWTTPREFEKIPIMPGPGSYDITAIPQRTHIKGGVMLTREKHQKADIQPGPGSYTVKPDTNSPSFTFFRRTPHQPLIVNKDQCEKFYDIPSDFDKYSKKQKGVGAIKPSRNQTLERLPDSVPGPGSYKITRFGDEVAHGFLIKTSPRILGPELLNSSTPGPGAYNIFLTPIPQMSRSTSPRKIIPRQQTVGMILPGPGSYDPQTTAKERNFRTILSKNSNPKDSDVPGPGAYETSEFLKSNVPTPRLQSISKKSTADHNCSVGPGSYDPGYTTVKSCKGPSFGAALAPRPPTSSPIGPGSYSVEKTEHCRGFRIVRSIEGLTVEHKHSDIPGPGHYDPVHTRRNSSLPFGTRNLEFGESHNIVPGPGTYNMCASFASQRGPKFVCNGNSTMNMQLERTNTVPGPGKYTPMVLQSKRSVTIGLGKKNMAETNSKFPGPGEYTPNVGAVRTTRNASVKMCEPTISSKYTCSSDTPGPGAYSISNSDISNTSKKNGVSLKGRHAIKEHDLSIPGPGTYNPSDIFTIPDSKTYKIPNLYNSNH